MGYLEVFGDGSFGPSFEDGSFGPFVVLKRASIGGVWGRFLWSIRRIETREHKNKTNHTRLVFSRFFELIF